jgi:multidrug efflux pump subunit AcrB
VSRLARFSVRNATVLHLMLVAVLIIGSVSLVRLPRELMSDIRFNWVFASAVYPGASAEEIELTLTLPMEEALQSIQGIESVETRSKEGFNFFNISFREMPDRVFEKRYRELKDALDKVELPDDAELTFVDVFSSGDFFPICQVVLHGDLDEAERNAVADDLEDDFRAVPGVADVQVGGLRERTVHVEVDPALLSATGVPINQVATALRLANTSIPGGTIETGEHSVLLRTAGEFRSLEAIGATVLGGDPTGGLVRVRDVARIVDGWEDERVLSRFNGKPAVTFSISKTGAGSSTAVVDGIREIAARYGAELGRRADITITGDTTVEIRDTLRVLIGNAGFGFALVVLVLWAALGIRNAVITAIGIPVTFLIAFIFMDASGQTLNGNALFGLVLVLGIIVDDAIVVLENIHRHQLLGKPLVKAVIDGTGEVVGPVTAAILTTVAAFIPLMLMPGIVGKFMRILPVVVTLTLLASLVEALVLVPAHITSFGNRDPGILLRRERWFDGLKALYERPLRWITRRRVRVVTTVGVYLVVVPVSILITLLAGQDLWRTDEIPQAFVWIQMPETSSLQATDAVVREAERACSSLPDLDGIIGNSGLMQTEAEWFINSAVGQIIIEFKRRRHREHSLSELVAMTRECSGGLIGPASVEVFLSKGGPPVGPDVEIKVQGDNWEQLTALVDLVAGHLRSLPGVYDVRDNFLPGKEELSVVVDEDRAALLGVDEVSVARALRAGFAGESPTVYREDDAEIDILVRYDPRARNDRDWVGRTRVPTRDGRLVPLDDVATVVAGQGLSAVRRFDYRRTITVSASLDRNARMSKPLARRGPLSKVSVKQKITPVFVTHSVRDYFDDVSARFPGYELDFTGQFQEFQDSFNALSALALVGAFFIYAILAAQFRSGLQPIIIMGFTFPGALLGSAMGLLISGNPFSITTMYALVGLLGIVVNDSLVMVSFINQRRAAGLSPLEACIEAGRVRMRPILLTTVTTVFGLLPMSVGLAGASPTWGPLASTVVWGLSFATMTTLFIIPPVYLTIEDLKKWWMKDRYRVDVVSREVRELEALDAEERRRNLAGLSE